VTELTEYILGLVVVAYGISCLIALVTFITCLLGIYIGKKAGTHLAGKAGIFGGVILIVIGLEIFITGII
jgi:putative Mn2+ efflux pump MntP